jgi:hypothetical protein
MRITGTVDAATLTATVAAPADGRPGGTLPEGNSRADFHRWASLNAKVDRCSSCWLIAIFLPWSSFFVRWEPIRSVHF